MKKLMFLLALLLNQAPLAATVGSESIGVKGGLSASEHGVTYRNQFVSDNFVQNKGVSLGLFADWFANSKFGITTEILYVQKGMTETLVVTTLNPEPVGTLKLRNKIEYLSLPLLVKGRFNVGKSTAYLLSGPRETDL